MPLSLDIPSLLLDDNGIFLLLMLLPSFVFVLFADALLFSLTLLPLLLLLPLTLLLPLSHMLRRKILSAGGCAQVFEAGVQAGGPECMPAGRCARRQVAS